jgi:hypothetical protein
MRREAARRSVWLAAVCVAVAACAHSGSRGGVEFVNMSTVHSITGVVVDERGRPVAGCRVTVRRIEDAGATEGLWSESDKSGQFILAFTTTTVAGLRSGDATPDWFHIRYRLTFEKEGYKTYELRAVDPPVSSHSVVLKRAGNLSEESRKP